MSDTKAATKPVDPKPAPRNATEELAEVLVRLVKVNRRLGALRVEKEQLIARRTALEASGA